jgi:nicotinamide mononucleotide transporter
LLVAVYTAGFGYYLRHYTDASLPYWDSFTTGGSLVAQYLLMRKRLENWLLWILVDIIYVPILWYKQLYPTSGLYALYLALAVYGYIEWRRALRRPAHLATI